ncbi:MAG TPA: hypothetical protein VIK33_11725 [Anaerolineae bacterium]
MGDMISRVEGERGLLERIADKIPGFRGYLDKEKRRDADKLLRDAVAARFQEQMRRLPEIQQQMLNSGGILFVDDVERAVTKLNMFVDRLKTSVRGYAGFFDAVKIKEDDLERVYHWDEQLLGEADKIAAAIDAVTAAMSSSGDVGAAVQGLIGAATAINDLYSQREHVLIGSV